MKELAEKKEDQRQLRVVCFKKEAVDRTDTVKKKFRPTKTHAHAKTIEACKKSSSNRKNKQEQGGTTREKTTQKQKFYMAKNPNLNRTHERKEIHVMGNGNQKLLQCLLLFVAVATPAAALHIIYDPKGKKRATERERERSVAKAAYGRTEY